MSLFSSSENFSQLIYSPSTSTVQVDSTTDINAGVNQVTDISDSYKTNIFRYDNSVRDSSTRLLDSLNTVYNAPALNVGAAAGNLAGMGLDLSTFFDMPATGSTAKTVPGIADGFFSSAGTQAADEARAGRPSMTALIALGAILVLAWAFTRRKKK